MTEGLTWIELAAIMAILGGVLVVIALGAQEIFRYSRVGVVRVAKPYLGSYRRRHRDSADTGIAKRRRFAVHFQLNDTSAIRSEESAQ